MKTDQNGKVYFKFFFWTSLIISLLLTAIINLIIYLSR